MSSTKEGQVTKAAQHTILYPNGLLEGKLAAYVHLLLHDTSKLGARMQSVLSECPISAALRQAPADWQAMKILSLLLQTKLPRIFAEKEVRGDGSDWTLEELSILGDVSFAVPVSVFDDGLHSEPNVHMSPNQEDAFRAILLFTCGALMAPDERGADFFEIVKSEKLDPTAYYQLYERRLLPCFLFASSHAQKQGRKAFITMPGLGCGQFAGRFQGQLGSLLANTVKEILATHSDRLQGISGVYFDPFNEGSASECTCGHITFIVRPLAKSGKSGRGQLCHPSEYLTSTGTIFKDCLLFSCVAWDHVSWPGNDYWDGERNTDDGVKAAATSAMHSLLGIAGSYDESSNTYNPPTGYRTWNVLVSALKLRLDTSLRRFHGARETFTSDRIALQKHGHKEVIMWRKNGSKCHRIPNGTSVSILAQEGDLILVECAGFQGWSRRHNFVEKDQLLAGTSDLNSLC